MTHPMPIPDEFFAIAASTGNLALSARFGVSRSSIASWRRRSGIAFDHSTQPKADKPYLRRKAPEGFRAMASTMGVCALEKHYRTNRRVINRWLEEHGIEKRRVHVKADTPPADFVTLAPTMTKTELMRHYGRHKYTIDKFIEQSGVQPREHRPPPPKPVSRQGAWRGYRRAPQVNHRDLTLEGQAADHLRHYAPVYRCDERGRYFEKGKFWRTGNVLLTSAELIERARRKGFDPDAWERIAA